jgi:CBS domain-containing protein
VLGYLASINLLLAIFNLIPGFPLDGGRVFRSIVWAITGSMGRATRIATRVGEIVGYVFIFIGLVEALVFGQLGSGIWLAFIGWFLYNAASTSGQQIVMDQVLQGVDVRDVMDPAPDPIPPTTSVQALVFQHLLTGGRRSVSVQGPDGTLLGLVTVADLRHVAQAEWAATPVSQIMTRAADLRTVTPAEDLRHAMQTLAENRYHQLPVVDNGRLVGTLDRGHVLQYLHLRQLMSRQQGDRSP